MTASLPEIVISKEQAVFWLDGQGRWCNRYGPFTHKKIIDKFHRAIARDANGYYVTQENQGRLEKVYFRYADTALFVFAVKLHEAPVALVLNTGIQIPLFPQQLFMRHDALYQDRNGEHIKFAERALWQISHLITEEDGVWWLVLDGVRHRIQEC